MRKPINAIALSALLITSCGGGSGGSGSPSPAPTPSPAPSSSASPSAVYTIPAQETLSIADVQQVIAEAVTQAKADNAAAVIAVTDRVGNVLALFKMNGAATTARIPSAGNGQNADVQGLTIPAEAAAVAKAITGAYLSSGGNAFSSRTASQIVQQHFPPAPTTAGLESGPLFGVQFSQLPCSDLSTRFGVSGSAAFIGPKRSPLGLAADAGGFPLYKNGVVVGGVGVIADGTYGFDANVLDTDNDLDERIALAGTVGFEAPIGIRANQISADGTTLRYSDASYGILTSVSGANYANVAPSLGALVPLIGYYSGTIIAGTPYGSEASGVRRATNAEFSNTDAFVLTDGAGTQRYPVRGATDAADVASPISAAEAKRILEEAFVIMSRARAQIRRPLDSRAQVTLSLVDTRGSVLGIVRSPDAPVFGIDVSLQKARSAAFFSGKKGAADLLGDPSTDVQGFATASRAFLSDNTAFSGSVAWTGRAIGNISRPYFPDGQVGAAPGPLSRPIAQFSPFSTGLQSALVLTNLAQHLSYATGASGTDTRQRCTFIPDATAGQNRLQNGIQIFPGSVPIYRGNVLIGALGVSGDGIDQDDMISFLGVNNAGAALGGFGNAAGTVRSDGLVIGSVRLRYIGCPFAPFLDTNQQNVCQGL